MAAAAAWEKYPLIFRGFCFTVLFWLKQLRLHVLICNCCCSADLIGKQPKGWMKSTLDGVSIHKILFQKIEIHNKQNYLNQLNANMAPAVGFLFRHWRFFVVSLSTRTKCTSCASRVARSTAILNWTRVAGWKTYWKMVANFSDYFCLDKLWEISGNFDRITA